MTRAFKKVRERSFVEEAAKHLGAAWHIGDDREHPDFLIAEGGKKFGLEVTEVFAGTQSRAGSAMKILESGKHKRIESLRQAFEATQAVPLRVQFVGDFCDSNLTNVVDALIAIDFPSKPVAHRVILDEHNGLRVHATKALRPEWYNVMDRVGWLDRAPQRKIADAIKSKAQELPRYKSAAGADVRLLIVADRLQNSGKLSLEYDATFDLRGFQSVYFYSRPECVTVLRNGKETDGGA